MKIKDIKLPDVVGIAGSARCGKDTFAILTQEVLIKSKSEQKVAKAGFADNVKQDCHKLLVEKAGISAYTEVTEEKELIRPLLVAYGTHLMRKINEKVWIRRMEPRLDLTKTIKASLFITDVRYQNEIDWIKENGGKVIYIEQEGLQPANSEEKKNDKYLRGGADLIVSWPKVGEGKTKSLKPKVSAALKKISCTKN